MAAEGLDIAGADTAAILERAIQNIPAFRKEYPRGARCRVGRKFRRTLLMIS